MSIDWSKLRTPADLAAQQLKTACRLAGEEQTRIWNEGRPA